MINHLPQLSNYLLRRSLTPGGRGVVEIWEFADRVPYHLAWRFQPTRNNPPVVVAIMLETDMILTVDEAATATVTDIQSKRMVRSLSLDGKPSTYGVLDSEGTTLFLVTRDRVGYKLVTVDVLNMMKMNELALDFNIVPGSLTYDPAGELFLYFPANAHSNRPNDGFARIDIDSGKIDLVFLDNSPTGFFDPPPVLFVPREAIGFRPYYGVIKMTRTEEGPRYLAELERFSLSDGQSLGTFTVRAFYPGHVFEDENPDYALSMLKSDPNTSEYHELRDEFLERINGLILSSDERSVWVAFHHRLLRRFSLSGEVETPLLAHPLNGHNEKIDPYLSQEFETPVFYGAQEGNIFFGDPPACVNPADIKTGQWESPLQILPESVIWKGDPSFEGGLDPLSWNWIKLDEPIGESSIQKALKAYGELLSRIDEARDGELLRLIFQFRDEVISEESFFTEATRYPDFRLEISDQMDILLTYPGPLLANRVTPAGLFATKALVMVDIQYMDLWLRYLSSAVIDPGLRSDPLASAVDLILSTYGWREETINMMLTRAVFQPESGLDQLLAHMARPSFDIRLNEVGLSDYFYHHTLFTSLLSEDFVTTLPKVHRLFEAVEDEALDEIFRLLESGVRTDLVHPEYGMTVQELARSIDNSDISKLLPIGRNKVESLFQDATVDMHQAFMGRTLEDIDEELALLEKRKRYITNKISAFEFDEMVSLSLDPFQQKQLADFRYHLRPIEQKIEQLGKEKIRMRRRIRTEQEGRDPFEFDPDSSRLNIFVRDFFVPEDRIAAINAIRQFINSISEFDVKDELFICFSNDQQLMDEEDFLRGEWMTEEVGAGLLLLLDDIQNNVVTPLWGADDVQFGLSAIKALCEFDPVHISRFIEMMKSGVIDSRVNQPYITEFVFNLVERYDWNEQTLALLVGRILFGESEAASVETRLLYKKGGLREFLENPEQQLIFARLLKEEILASGKPVPKTIRLILPESIFKLIDD